MSRLQIYFGYFILLMLALIPFAWSRYVNANYYTAKTFLVYLTLPLILIYVTLGKNIILPRIKEHFVFITAAAIIIAYNLIQPFLYPVSNFYFTLGKTLSFIGISLFTYNLLVHQKKLLNSAFFNISFLIFLSGLLGINLYELYNVRFDQGYVESWRYIGTFGNTNMMAEFFLITLPLIFLWQRRPVPKSTGIAKLIILSLWCFFILYTRSRSTWIGLGLWAVYQLFRGATKKELLALTFSCLLYFAITHINVDYDRINNGKANSFTERASLYNATSQLIIDHPFGIGLNNFINKAIPYRLSQDFKPYEFEYADQPHSDLLKWFVQYGWLGGLSCLLILGVFFGRSFVTKDNLLISASLAFLPQFLFQFPFENPATILALSIYLGYALNLFYKPVSLSVTKFKRILFIMPLVFYGLANSSLFLGSIISESHYKDNLEVTSTFCNLYPINLRNCVNKTTMYINQDNPTAARKSLLDSFDTFYFTSDFQRLLVFYFQSAKQPKYLCESAQLYKEIYPKQTFFEVNIFESCNTIGSPVKFVGSPRQFDKDYTNWLQKALN